MSAYSDWKCGALTDKEYTFCANHETGADHGEEPYDDYYDDDDEENHMCELRDGYRRWK